jgi:hypothetical protein
MRGTLFVQIFGVSLALLAWSAADAADFDPSRAPFDSVLKSHVKDARVNYTALKARPQELDRFLDQVAAVGESEFKRWTEKQQIAFLINAYNAYTLRLILDHYPVKSIKDIGTLFKGPWDQPVVHLFGRTLTLNTVEHKMLRTDYNEPRIHFALVCAANGCPPLRGEAYVADRLDKQLKDQARQFLADAQKNRVDARGRTVYLSPIFKWYGEDFEKKSGGVLQFLKPYWPENEGATVATDDFKIRYTDYDWSLNAQGK